LELIDFKIKNQLTFNNALLLDHPVRLRNSVEAATYSQCGTKEKGQIEVGPTHFQGR
jgi:hypothetical protein